MQALEAVRRLCDQSGLPIYLAGGPVRDALLGSPVLDLDFSIEGDAIELARSLAEMLDGRVTSHSRFGTATVLGGDCRIDLVSSRKESYRRPGELPIVKPGGIADDLARRDFSINAMALPLSPQGAGILDPHKGLDDLEAGVIRTLHRRSFADDPTRMLRAVRYEQRFGFRINDATMKDMASCVASGHMDAVSGDRWRHELQRILDEADPGPALSKAAELGLLAGIHPSFAKFGQTAAKFGLAAARKNGELNGRIRGAASADYWLGALFSAMTIAEAEAAIHRLRFTGRQAAIAHDTIVIRESEAEILAASAKPSHLVAALSGFEVAAVFAWASLTDNPSAAAALHRYADELRFVRPWITGDALMEMGVPQGPRVGEILARLLNARLDGEATTRNDEMALLQGLMSGSCDSSAG